MIDTNLIIGRLGSGKTTCIKHLIANIPKNEYWAIIVNEFGQVGIDSALLSSHQNQEINITEINGGCICCAAQSQLRVSLTNLIRQRKPDRIIIEATGLGHPAGIIDLLRDEFLQPIISISSIITVIDLTLFEKPHQANNLTSPISTESFKHQTQLADIIVLNKKDLVTDVNIKHANEYLELFYPVKRAVFKTSQAKIDIKSLSLPSDIQIKPILESKNNKHYHSHHETLHENSFDIELYSSEDNEHMSVGVIFPATITFIRRQLQDLFDDLLVNEEPVVIRLKAVFNCGKFWQSFNALNSSLNIEESYYRRDSRIEIIIKKNNFNTEDFKNNLIKCIKETSNDR